MRIIHSENRSGLTEEGLRELELRHKMSEFIGETKEKLKDIEFIELKKHKV